VVFCQDVAPDTVYESASSTCTLRRYLDAGGKVVWYGDIPLCYQGHSDGTKTDMNGSIDVLGFNAAGGVWGIGDQVTLTDEGRAWGLTNTWPSLRPAQGSDLRILARDSSGQAAAWVKHYLPDDTYRGFVRFSDYWDEPNVMDVRRLTEYPSPPVRPTSWRTGHLTRHPVALPSRVSAGSTGSPWEALYGGRAEERSAARWSSTGSTTLL